MPMPMHHWFAQRVPSAADQPALRIGRAVRTYAELHEIASRWAWWLRSSSQEPPARVALTAEKSETRYLGFLATLYAGATVVPVNTQWPDSRISRVLDAASVDTLIVDSHHVERAARNCDPGRPLRVFGPADQEKAFAASQSYMAGECSDEDIAYIIFTSGSSGEPKGVPISHENVSAFLTAIGARYDIGSGDVFTQLSDISFDLSIFEIFGAWSLGACVCPVSKLQAAVPARCVSELGITVWTSTPSLATMLSNRDGLPANSLSQLRHIVFCGEPLPVRTARRWMAAAPSACLDNLYGPTEATVACTGSQVMPGSSFGDFDDTDTVPIGAPFPGMECMLEPSDGLADPSGELCLSGPQVFSGYVDSGSDAQRFITAGGRRWYRTGDRVRRTQAHGLVHLGRVDEQVKINGYRIELAEVERSVEHCVPGASCCAVAIGAPGGPAVLGVFVTEADDGGAALRSRLARDLPAYMVPTYIWPISQLPLNQNGKIDRVALRERSRELLGHNGELRALTFGL
jgi:amino acid adenylation domain-containing protein